MTLPTALALDVILTVSPQLRGKRPSSQFLLDTNKANKDSRWDPATGLGTPNFPKMKKLYMELP